ncbi:MAG: hypothetical protein IPM37_11770 [Hahellaceae bacterium]|nr:hypothetical protein [Hahellaceae bacterium]
MLRLPFQRTLLVLSISSALVACGGSSSSSSPTTGGEVAGVAMTRVSRCPAPFLRKQMMQRRWQHAVSA